MNSAGSGGHQRLRSARRGLS